jgi:GntR family transcriptional regulator of vanillate catabolism
MVMRVLDPDESDDGGTGLDHATQRLRELVLAGVFPPDRKIAEEAVARALAVSRTPARIAMATLEREGLLVRTPRRGCRVRSFSIQEVIDGIEVRGELEGMAARLLAERGTGPDVSAELEASLAASESVVEHGAMDVADRLAWTQANLAFHRAIVAGAGNAALLAAFERVNLIPLVSPRFLVFAPDDAERARAQLRRAHEDHVRVVDAIRARRGTRAAEIMRDHSLRSGETKRRNMGAPAGGAVLVGDEGAALVRLHRPDAA